MMKTARKIHTGGKDCSCVSSLTKSASDNPSIGRFIAQGSRIDRLYYGKYIPMRERKLLERLVRTRAVYDDIRAQLISDSTISLSTKGDSKAKNKVSSKDQDDTETDRGAIFDIVDRVDKGATLGLRESCICCSCSSDFQEETRNKRHRSYLGSRRQVVQKERLDVHRKKKGVRFKAKHIRSDPCTCTFKFSGLFKNKKDALKKNIPMEPLDLQQLTNEERPSKQMKVREFARRSYENIKQSNKHLGQKVLEGIEKVKESKTNIQERLQFDAQASAVKLKQTTNRLKSKNKSAPSKRESKAVLQLNDLLGICMCPENQIFQSSKESLIDIYKQKSKEKIIQAKNKLKSAMKSTMERKPKITKNKSKISGTYIAPDKDIALQVKKDSIRKFQEELRRKQIMKDWECDPECIEDTCVPEECYIKLKNKRKHMKHRGLEHHTRKHEKRSGIVLSQKNEKIQEKALTVQNKNTNPKRDVKKTEVKEQEKKEVKKKVKKEVKEKIVSPKKESSSRQGVRIKSSYSFEIEFFKNKPNMASKEPVIPKPTPSGINYKMTKNPKVYTKQRNSQVLLKRSSRDTQTEKRSLKSCFCTLQLKSKKSKVKHKKKHRITTAEKSITTLEPVAPCKQVDCSVEMCEKLVCEKLLQKVSNAQTSTGNKIKKKRDIKLRHLLPYECEPGVCTPDNCDPYECIKLINMREAKFKDRSANCFCVSRKTKSTSTLTSRSNKASKAKIAQSLYSYGTQIKKEGKPKMERKNVHNVYGRQAVQIGSTFSFNIEFYKNKPPQYYPQHYPQTSDLKSFVVKPKVREISKPKLKERAYQGDVASIHKNIPTQMYKKGKDAGISTSLKKCFCTLKLQRKSHSKLKKKKIVSTGTKTIKEPITSIVTSTKGTKTKQKHMHTLKPYECEPFTCIPGECNPYECLERINRRNLKDIGVSSAFNRSEINKGSSTSEKSLKAVKTQSKPRSREQKVLTKVKKPKRHTQTFKEKVSYTSSAPSRQAVKLGSTFSFNIEFYKNKPALKEIKTNYQMRPTVKLDTRPATKNTGVKIVKLNVANLDTQVEELKKHDKTSATKPLLKRCFCTLNLQKKKNNARTTPFKTTVMHSQVYTVNTAMVKQNRLSIFKTHCTKDICLSKNSNININNNFNGQLSDCVIKSLYSGCRRLNSNKHLQCKSCYPLITNQLETIKSNFNTALKLISQSYICDNLKLSGIGNPQLMKGANNVNQYSSHVNEEKKCIVYTSRNFNGEKKHLSGLRHFLKGYFCTMNLQVVRNKYTANQKNVYSDQGSNRHRKLEPYECEPGICVPGECDPYECLKLMSKRGSNFSKRTGTENTVTSSSSYTDRSPKYKSYKVQSQSQKTTKPQATRVYQDQHKLGDKQAVRVGSSFSFDIEFFKNAGSPQIANKTRTPKPSPIRKPPRPKRTYTNSKTTGMNNQNFRNRHSQSAFSKTLQKASATLPKMKRCFCTLKLQKKGRLQKEQKQPTESMQTDAIIPQSTTVDRGQKAPKFKPLKIAPLEPYECPPGICVPGECNPYKCLELMKKLNYQTADSGTEAITGDTRSSGSMTSSARKHRTRKVNVKPKVISKSNLSEKRQKIRIQPPTNVMNSTKQAVRIGSSFSFNIEFHKSNNSLDYPKDSVMIKPPKRVQHNMSDLRKRNIKIKQRSSETSTARRNQHSQFKNTAQAASTMTTSFMKRCFCVLNLRKNKKTKVVETNVVKTVNKPVNVDKKTNTKRHKERVLQLEPYECEPGICIPGECDPYACEKIIKRRNLRSQSSSTAYKSTRSTSSSSPPSGTRNINTQFRPIKTTRDSKKQVYTKTKVPDSKRQAVKIGSSFSFNIEFYKDKTSKLKDYEIPRAIKRDMLSSKEKHKKQKTSGTKSPSVSFKSQTSQIQVNRRDFAAGINNVIKRCFCTLQLQRSRKKEGKTKEKKQKPIEKPIEKIEVQTKSVMTTEKNKVNLDLLEPYECEPNICVPGECDPYECEKLIKLRQRKHKREIGMSTQHTSQSAASSTAPFKKSKKKTQSMSVKKKEVYVKERNQNVKSFKRIQEGQSKQCVKIGSSFSFDIEFFKNKNAAGLQFDQKPQYRQPKLQVKKMHEVRQKAKTKTQGLQSQKLFNTSPSQMDQLMKTESTMARFTPPLKRCFCTLFLKKPKKEPIPKAKPIMSNVSAEAKLRDSKVQQVTKVVTKPVTKAVTKSVTKPVTKSATKAASKPVTKAASKPVTKAASKPVTKAVTKLVTTPVSKPITKSQSKLLPYECEPNICIPGECNPLECLERIKNRLKQQKSYGTSTKHLRRNKVGSSMLQTKTRNRRSQFKTLSHEQGQQRQQQYKQLVTNNSKKQAVRIGSNFSFSIDFYKQRGLGDFEGRVSNEHKQKSVIKSKPLHTKYKNKQVSKKYHNTQQNRGSQSQGVEQFSKSSAVEPFLKRCFCTLKLQKKPAPKVSKTALKTITKDVQKVSKPKIVSIDKGTLTKKYKTKTVLDPYECEPNICIPGECDPYECLKRIEARNLKNISTQILKPLAQKSVGMNLANMDSKNIQSNLISNLPKKSKVSQSNIVEIPRFGNLFNKQAVKIGSNFSFNIEFYKEILPPTAEMYSKIDKDECCEDKRETQEREKRPKKPKKYTDSVNTSTLAKHHNKGIQGDGVKTDNKALEVGNALKRCFCTLKLQKELNSKLSKPNMQKPQYPQVIEVRRVSVKNNNKQTLTEVKSIGTKTKAKYIKATCNPDTCSDFKKKSPQEMKVILPYAPNKYNKTPSKTMQNQQLHNITNTKPRKTKLTNRGKRLTKKRSKNSIQQNQLLDNDFNPSNHSLSTLKKFMCKCAQLFSRKTNPENLDETKTGTKSGTKSGTKTGNKTFGNKITKYDRRSYGDDFDQKSNRSHNLKYNRKCNEDCKYFTNENKYQAGDTVQNPTMSLKMTKKHQMDNAGPLPHNKQSTVKESQHQKDNKKTKHIQENVRNETDGFFCTHCRKSIKMNKRHSQPLKVHFVDTPTDTNKDVGKKGKKDALLNKSVDQIDKHRKSLQKSKNKTDAQLAKYCKFCTTCGEKLNNEEIQKAAGDQKSIKNESKESGKSKNFFNKVDDNICSAKGPEPPLFEMHLDSDDYGILNKEEVIGEVKRLREKSLREKDKHKDKPHGESCRCCICLGKKNKTGATFNVPPRGSAKRKQGRGRTLSHLPTGKPCVCGSEVCAEELANMGKESYILKHRRQPCDCGSPICARETRAMNAIFNDQKNLTCICAAERAKELKKTNEKKQADESKNRAKRLKKYREEDKIRTEERRKKNKNLEKKINKDASDLILMVESLIDIGKMGVKAGGDVLRVVARTAIDPKQAYRNLKEMKENPEMLVNLFKSREGGGELSSTCRRIRLRCLSMRGVKNVRSILERYALTNYLLYMFHKDPSKRIVKRRREREQLDFNCSLYMGSLRKRPYLSVYNRFPWFYPHFLSLVNVWKQFMEVSLFLLAVVVWSPCIFCMEACRACMCCFFCTG